MSRSLSTILLASSLTAGCVSARPPGSPPAYRPSDIVHNIQSLNGREIRVAGYFRLGAETRALWDSRPLYEAARERGASGGDPIWNHCITAYYDIAIAREVESAAGSVIDAVGTVGIQRDGNESVDLWGCNDVHITIHRILPRRDNFRGTTPSPSAAVRPPR